MSVLSTLRNLFIKSEKRSGVGYSNPSALRIFNVSESGVNVTEETALSVSALARAIGIRANILATLPKKIYKRVDGGIEEDLEHPLHRILTLAPNEEQTAFDFWHAMEVNAVLRGGAGAEIIRDEKMNVVSLRLMRYGASLYKSPSTGKLWIVDNEDGKVFFPDETIFIPGLLVTDSGSTKTLISYFRDTFGEALSARMMAMTYFKNGPFVGGVYNFVGPKKDKDGLEAFSIDLRNYFGGADKAGMILPIPASDKFQPFPLPDFTRAQLFEFRKFGIEEVARITGVPVSLLSELDKPSYNSLSELFRQFKIATLDPRMTQYDQELNRKLLKNAEYGKRYIETDIDELLWSSPNERAQYWETLFKISAIKPNEIREYLNKNPVEGGDQVFVFSNNLVPISEIDKVQKNGNSKPKTQNGATVGTRL